MKKKLQIVLCFALALIAMAAFVACKGNDEHTHDWGEWETATAAGCETEGLAKRVCKLDATHVDEKKLNAVGHSWDDGVITTKPTCTINGIKTYTCGNTKL